MLGLESLEGEFVIRKDGQLIRHTKARDLPAEFDHLIKFAPNSPPPPHTVNDHVEMSKYADYLQELMSRETK
tara:strand:+ start:648 stop:863 length:216 start_codon:yes stop_codon:yes gene_type:complete